MGLKWTWKVPGLTSNNYVYRTRVVEAITEGQKKSQIHKNTVQSWQNYDDALCHYIEWTLCMSLFSNHTETRNNP